MGELLVERKLVQTEDIDKALVLQASVGARLGSLLIRLGAISEDALLPVLACQLNLQQLSDSEQPELLATYHFMSKSNINFEWYLSQNVVIWPKTDQVILCIARDIIDPHLKEVMNFHFAQENIIYRLATSSQLDRLLDYLEKEHSVDSLLNGDGDARHLKELAEEAPVIELVNNVMAQAVDAGASDVHVEPQENTFAVRLRVDGVLQEQMTQPIERFAAVASRIKLTSGLDIAERRLPQDGRKTLRISGQEMDIRVSTAPGVHGESIVMRLLPKDRDDLSLENLGMESDHLALMYEWMSLSNGIVLVTGPTGSGKSTTLYSSLAATNDGFKKVITVEDPVEFQLNGITQIQAHADIGYTFARALRAILRQDPDVIMIGEIRDLETADIAIQSALTGHLVLSTLHTNDAISCFNRLTDMGVEPYLVAAPIKGVQAQRLVRRVCPSCCKSSEVPFDIVEEVKKLPQALVGKSWVEAVGCDRCSGTGYKGRIGIYEMIAVSEKMQNLIVASAPLNDLKHLAEQEGYRDLYQDGLIKASKGITTLDEVMRVAKGEH
ncbi:MAG: Flp pilus assembly complex ATPase component TadA [Pseudomonadales bacterium]|nr:Flp pilus assembly complex ATPase component TadA [Pseudomonadales bacterium]